MEAIDNLIEEFLKVEPGYGSGSGYGSGDGYGDGSGDGSGDGDGDGSGSGYGYGYGYGYGSGSGYGSGYGDGSGVKEYDGRKVYRIDGVPTIIEHVRGNLAKGFILQMDLTLTPCFIAKGGIYFAHGDTAHDAVAALQEKMYDDSSEEERIAAFVAKFPEFDTPYPNKDLFHWHHVLTGSCKAGRMSFIHDRGIDLNGSTSVRDFIELTKNSYGGRIMSDLAEAYE